MVVKALTKALGFIQNANFDIKSGFNISILKKNILFRVVCVYAHI